jgi:acetylornithine/N-succinyldiaminopimelate aminotransferase
MPNYRFISFDSIEEMDQALDDQVAAVILEPIQGEGGVRVPSKDYLSRVEQMCEKNGSLLIVDEIQTGFCRTGPMFVTESLGVKADFLTMAKGIAGGFPFGAFAMSERVTSRLELGDHGGTYCGNPLGCAVAYAVIHYLIEKNISENVKKVGLFTLERLKALKRKYPDTVVGVRGKGLLLLIELRDEETAGRVSNKCLSNGLFVRQTQQTGIRIFPALNIRKEEVEEGLNILEASVKESV